jgi:predicted DNA-binding ribbon-helix-helix protein
MIKRSVIVAGHRTSISLEPEFWDELSAIAVRRGVSMNALISEIDRARGEAGNLSSAARLHVLADVKNRSADGR